MQGQTHTEAREELSPAEQRDHRVLSPGPHPWVFQGGKQAEILGPGAGLCPTEGAIFSQQRRSVSSFWSKCGQTHLSTGKSRQLGIQGSLQAGANPQVLSGCQLPAPGTVGRGGKSHPGALGG